MKMKSIDLFCASPASTAICSTMDNRSIIRPSTKPIDRRQIHRLGESSKNRPNQAPCSSHLPIDPVCKSSRSTYIATAKHTEISRRKSSADVDDRYLLSDKPYMNFILNNETALVSSQPIRDNKRLDLRSLSTNYSGYESPRVNKLVLGGAKPNYEIISLNDQLSVEKSLPVVPTNRQQVVELMVSIHCKGCEGKLRKHISKMEGVTSFTIDLETKKVRIVGNVTPLGVLTSISKVKNAQFWPSPNSSSSSSSSSISSPRVSVTK